MEKKRILLLSAAGLLLLAAGLANSRKALPRVFINEVCSKNGRIIRDGVYDCSDYIELYNASGQRVDLTGWYLSDDEASPRKYALPECEIQPGAYLVFYANGMEGGLNLPFKISNAGEKIFLSDREGALVDSVAVPELGQDETYARKTDGADVWAIKEATLLASNESGAELPEVSLEKPQFSAVSGFYDEAFYLTLQAKPEETIYYTLDGSIPTEDSLPYEEPILVENRSGEPNQYVSQRNVVKNWRDYTPVTEPVDKAFVVRAIAVNRQGKLSQVATETYFIDIPQYEDMSVISLSADPGELFGEDGIFATGEAYDVWYENGEEGESPIPNFLQRGRSWEVEADMQFFEKGQTLSNHAIGIRAQGNTGRSQGLKRLSLFCRKEYSGSRYFDSGILGKERVHSLMTNEYVSNAVLPCLVEDRDVGIQQSRTEPVALFINGEYWYTRYVLEKFNGDCMAEIFGINPENVVLMKNDQVEMGEPEHESLFRGMQAMASDESLMPDEKYEKLSEVIDLQSFIDYFSINAYLCNMNMNEVENYVLWRTVDPESGEYGDTRWRWLIYDVEALESLDLEYYGYEERAAINSFTHPQDWTGYILNENSIYQGLKECDAFKKQFVLSFLDIANVNFAPETVEPILNQYDLDLTWLEGFFLKRFDYIAEDLKEEFSLTGTLENVTLEVNDPNGGTILLNTTSPDLSQGSWRGSYFTDFPVTVTAVPSRGYRFAGWEGSCKASEETVEVPVAEGGITLQAVFEKI